MASAHSCPIPCKSSSLCIFKCMRSLARFNKLKHQIKWYRITYTLIFDSGFFLTARSVAIKRTQFCNVCRVHFIIRQNQSIKVTINKIDVVCRISFFLSFYNIMCECGVALIYAVAKTTDTIFFFFFFLLL